MRTTEFVTSYIDAWNQQDSQAVANHLAENGTYIDIPVHQNMSRQQLIAHLDELFEQETYFYQLTGEVLAGETTVAFQYEVFPRKPLSDSQQAETWFGAEFITLCDGAAVEISDYYEQSSVPSPQSPMASAAGVARVHRYAKSGLSTAQMEVIKRQLSELMATDKTYLRPDLTLPDLAETLQCSVNHVSQAINAGFGVSFFDYLNEYRIKDAMDLLCQNDGESRTVLSVALEVGFNSASTFYEAFKKVTGETPAHFRRIRPGQSRVKAGG
ncbi:MAG: helix-turn-helix domain-containing protein [Pseudomonadales bacterium]